MTKPKHQIFCPDAGKPKILFESERKAMRYIDFNAEEIASDSGYAPCRAYFCQCCGGWHVTHNQGYTSGIGSAEAVIRRYNSEKQQIKESKAAENRIKNKAVAMLQNIKDELKEADQSGIRPSDYNIAKYLDYYSRYEDDCKAPNLKKHIKYYFTKLGIEL